MRKRSNCFTCQNRERSEWCQLSRDELGLLDRAKTCNTYKPGRVIFYQGNPCVGIYCVEEGTVALRKTDADGNTMIVRLAMPGETLGYRAYFADEPYSCMAEARTTARICFIDRAALSKLLAMNPMLGHTFTQHIAKDLRRSEESRLRTTALSVRARLAHLLLALKERYAQVDSDGAIRIDLPLARQDIASMLGSRPETIARTIRSLEDDGVARFDRRHVVVDDLDCLLDEIEPAV